MKQKEIKFGNKSSWPDIEADEVDVSKNISEDGAGAKWEQWGDLVERGRSGSLLLVRLNPRTTKPRAPGPWTNQQKRLDSHRQSVLKNRSVILHTDGARAYKMDVPGVAHYNVVRKKKKVMVQGKARWVLPHYTKVFSHKLPTGKTIQVKSGTQIIDRFSRRSPSGICEPHAQGARSPVDLLVPGHQSLGIHWTHAPGALMHMPQGKWLLHASSCWLLQHTSPPSFQSLSWNICNHVWPTSTAHLHHMLICNVLAHFSFV